MSPISVGEAKPAIADRLRGAVRQWPPTAITLGAPVPLLGVLIGLNAVDELDRTAFAVLLPDIRDPFRLTNAAALGLVAGNDDRHRADRNAVGLLRRRNRIRIATTGAAIWAVFSAATGLAISVAMLAAARVDAGGGKAVVTPTHSSLLADYYEPAARVKVFSAYRLASSIGQILGPLLAGSIAMAFGWRARSLRRQTRGPRHPSRPGGVRPARRACATHALAR